MAAAAWADKVTGQRHLELGVEGLAYFVSAKNGLIARWRRGSIGRPSVNGYVTTHWSAELNTKDWGQTQETANWEMPEHET